LRRTFGEGVQGDQGKKPFEMTPLLEKNILELTEESGYFSLHTQRRCQEFDVQVTVHLDKFL